MKKELKEIKKQLKKILGIKKELKQINKLNKNQSYNKQIKNNEGFEKLISKLNKNIEEIQKKIILINEKKLTLEEFVKLKKIIKKVNTKLSEEKIKKIEFKFYL